MVHLVTDVIQRYAAHKPHTHKNPNKNHHPNSQTKKPQSPKKKKKLTRRKLPIVIQLFILQLNQYYTYLACYCIPVVCC